jgi:hypothetical protein
LLLTSGEI